MEHRRNTKSFASRWGFILASVGSAVGMANVWGFPNKMGSNGGGAFLLIYLLFIFIFSYVGLPAEFAMGRRAAIGAACLRPGQIVVDVGIHVDAEGRLSGDVDFAAAEPVVEAITPVPGGVGTVTTSVLVRHVVEAAERLR